MKEVIEVTGLGKGTALPTYIMSKEISHIIESPYGNSLIGMSGTDSMLKVLESPAEVLKKLGVREEKENE